MNKLVKWNASTFSTQQLVNRHVMSALEAFMTIIYNYPFCNFIFASTVLTHENGKTVKSIFSLTITDLFYETNK
ncbi:hypothetical protein T12_16385 [Trichinella patagoniensis]|uniref:Uncharacterized protein n=1 Tax=Trichinella patagoniensis TaxID=990121 RepID=A0A0V1AGH9_9BILA|nr:hypothetical protein T12_16385 [Trichinella patagoniensis]